MELVNLSEEELIHIDGGKPTVTGTSFAYDLFWGIGWVGREIWEIIKSDEHDSSYVNAKVGSY